MLSLLLGALISTPAAARCAPADCLAFVEAPAPRNTYSRAASSAFKQAARALVPESMRKSTAPQVLTVQDSGEVQRWPTPTCKEAPRALADDAQYAAVSQAAPEADVRGRFDLQRLFTLLRHQSLGASYEQALRRLGVHRLQAVRFNARLLNPKQWSGSLDVMGPAPEGFFAALAPPLPPAWPAGVPAGSAFASAAVRPSKMWMVGEGVLAGVYPLEYSLARVQLDAMEDERGKRWVEDILGDAPQLWSTYQVTRASALETLLVLGVQDGQAAHGFLLDALGIVADIAHGFSVKSGEVHKTKTLTINWKSSRTGRSGTVVLAFFHKSLIAAPSAESLQAHLAGADKAGAWSGEATPALAFGQGDSARILAQILDGLRVDHPSLPAMGQSRWTLAAASEGGWHASVTGTP